MLVWVAILVLAVLNEALRDTVLVHALGPTTSRFLSGIALCIIILAAAALTAPGFGKLPLRSFWLMGALWLVLTLVFEVVVGYAQHHSWRQLLDAYTLQGGNLWPFVLLTTFVSPRVGARIRGVA